jgi:hypothetical protein
MRKQLIAAGTAIALGMATTMIGTIAFARGGGGGGGLGGGGHVGGFGGGGHVAILAAEVTVLAPVSEASVSRQATAVSESSGSRWITPASKATGSPGATPVSATVVSDTVALLKAFTLTAPTVAWVRTGPIPGIAIRTATRTAATGIS